MELSIFMKNQVPLYGICEWDDYFAHADETVNVNDVMGKFDSQLEKHLEAGFENIVWALGRATLSYWSEYAEMHQPAAVPKTHILGNLALKEFCPLRRAIEWCRGKNIRISGRLCMNRFYQPGQEFRSVFAEEHPEYCQKTHDGKTDYTRMTYAVPEVRKERCDILLEAQRLGVDALVLDFCRQPPMAGYHEEELKIYTVKTGKDPRKLQGYEPEIFTEWFRCRAQGVTDFMRGLRNSVAGQEQEYGRKCPVIIRIPANSNWLLLAAGIDLDTWYEENLFDSVMLSPLLWCANDMSHHFEYHVSRAHHNSKRIIGGIGSLNLIPHKIKDTSTPHASFEEQPVWDMAYRQLNAGVDGMSVYQTDTLCNVSWLKEIIPNLGRIDVCSEKKLGWPSSRMNSLMTACDWHTNNDYGLNGTGTRNAL